MGTDQIAKAMHNAREARPVLLTKGEAMEFAARQLDRMAAELDLIDAMTSIWGEAGAELEAKLAGLRKAAPEPGLQAAAVRDAAAAIREMVFEDRVRAARLAVDRGFG